MRLVRFAVLLIAAFFAFGACDDNVKQELILKDFDAHKFYAAEIMPDSCLNIYGNWKLVNVSGGFSGAGHPLNFDYLYLKSVGIYGLIRNDSLLEYGKVEIKTFDNNQKDVMQIELIPEHLKTDYSLITYGNKYVYLSKDDKLDLNSPCCDMYNYHFVRK